MIAFKPDCIQDGFNEPPKCVVKGKRAFDASFHFYLKLVSFYSLKYAFSRAKFNKALGEALIAFSESLN